MQMEWNSIKLNGKPQKEGQYLVTMKISGYNIISLVGFTLNPYKLDKYDFAEYKNKETDGIFYTSDPDWGFSDYCNKVITAWCEVPEAYDGD